MKKIVSVLLCLILTISMLSMSAYADRGFLLKKSEEAGVLLHDTWVYYYDAGGNKLYDLYPENSTVTLFEDLYSNDYYAVGSIYHSSKGRMETVWVPASAIYFFPDHVR